MRMFNKSSLNAPLSILGALVISACSSGGSVTTLDASPQVPVSLPQFLFDASQLNPDDLSPTILLSTGATVSMQKGNGNEWSGTINVTPGTAFTATITWNEAFQGQQLPLARRVESLEVATDGSVVTTDSTDYSTDIDNDSDGTSNFDERVNDTDPFTAPASENPPPSADDSGSTDNNADPATAPAQTPSTDNSAPDDTNQNADQTENTPTDSNQPDEPSSNPTPPNATDDSNNSDSSPSSEDNTNTDDASSSNDSETPSNDDPANTADGEQSTDSSDDESDNNAPAIVDVIVPRIARSAAPVIDGSNVTMDTSYNLTGEWASAIQTDGSGAELVIENLMIDEDAEDRATDGTAFRRWGAMHDGTYLYIVVVVDDNGDRRRDSQSDLTDDDSLELFLDADNSKSTSYGSNDFHRIFPGKLAGADKQSASSGDIAGPNSSDINITFATGPGIGPRGIRRARYEQDVYELRIDLSEAGISTDEAFGFELQVNDDDAGGNRNAKYGWKHPAGNGADADGTSSNPSLMGTLKLE